MSRRQLPVPATVLAMLLLAEGLWGAAARVQAQGGRPTAARVTAAVPGPRQHVSPAAAPDAPARSVALATPAPAHGQFARRIVVTPDTAPFDAPVAVRVTGLAPGDTATLRASAVDVTGRAFTSAATFVADARGEVNVTRQAPARGDYEGVEPMGLFWSMAPANPPPFFYRSGDELPGWLRRRFPFADTAGAALEAAVTRLDVDVGGRRVASTTVVRRLLPPRGRVTRVREHGLFGLLYEPPGAEPHPALLALTGSSGGIVSWWSLLAGHGYTVFALAWLDAPGTSKQMTDVPLEYFDTALAWLRRRPGVDTARMGVIGWSLGGEATLLLASRHPELKAAVSLAGSPVVWEGVLHDTVTNAVLARPTGRSTWTHGGAPLPFVTRKWSVLPPGLVGSPGAPPRPLPNAENHRMYVATLEDTAGIARATMPLERSNAAFLLLGARDDEAWPSAALAQIAIDRLRRAGYSHPYEQVIYDVGGHGVALPAYTPVAGLRVPPPALAAQIAHNRADAWARELRFLDEHLARVRVGARTSTEAAPAKCAVAAVTSPLEVATNRGVVRGAAGEGVIAFLGIPFAARAAGASVPVRVDARLPDGPDGGRSRGPGVPAEGDPRAAMAGRAADHR